MGNGQFEENDQLFHNWCDGARRRRTRRLTTGCDNFLGLFREENDEGKLLDIFEKILINK